jgi:Xaa-Pro aminopeptidase
VRIGEHEHAARRAALAARLDESGLSGCVLYDPHFVLYYTGFHFIATERPIAFVLARDGRGGMLVPRLEVGPEWRAQSPWYEGAVAGYRGQIGRNASIPHAHAGNIVFQAGDVLVTGATSPVWGYHSELERTMVVGPPSDEQRRMFEHMVALQDIAFAAIRPGARCADVDLAVRAYYDEHALWDNWRHHVGHAIGIRYHEGPFLDRGDPTIIRPGMVFTVEPGLYAPGLGGFRHSDTVAVTGDGLDFLTDYPRDLEALTLSS